MKQKSIWAPRRLIAAAVIGCLQIQNAIATVSQYPSLYITPPDVNVMFTLDDSGSMNSDVIPDLPTDLANFPSQTVATVVNTYFGGRCAATNRFGQCTQYDSPFGTQFPMMWHPQSGFMNRTYYADSAISRFLRSAASNPLYYDRTVTYTPWPDPSDDSKLLPAAEPTKVNIHAYDPRTSTTTLNITAQITDSNGNKFWPATYYIYKGASAYAPVGDINSSSNTSANFTKVEIQSGTKTYARAASDSRTDCGTGSTCTYDQEIQNFANWLQYYHSRMLMAKGGVAAAFAKQGTNLRVGFATINSTNTVRLGVSAFTSGTGRSRFYNEMYPIVPNGGTKLRATMDAVGQYFSIAGKDGPWAATPGATAAPEYACRKSFHILSTDGYWNGDGAATAAATKSISDTLLGPNNTNNKTPKNPRKGNAAYLFGDSIAADPNDPLVGRFTLSPFVDDQTDKLANVAAYYWRTDLRTDLDDKVAPSSRDPAFWQHLTTYTVGLGINGSGNAQRTSDGSKVVPTAEANNAKSPFAGSSVPWLSTSKLRDALVTTKTPMTWPAIVDGTITTGDDLIRSAMVGRGQYFSASDPKTLADSLAGALAEVVDQPIDLTSVAADAPQVSDSSRLYQATFNPNKWYGRLYAFDQDNTSGAVGSTAPSTDTKPNPAQIWEASLAMPLPANRNIFTFDPTTRTIPGLDFLYTSLTASQKTALNSDPNLVTYLRGDGSLEIQNGGSLRDRARYTLGGKTGGVLGDIVNGSPIKGPDAGGNYNQLSTGAAATAYSAFRDGTRTDLLALSKTIFVAANDGMLHAFNMNDGVERFAYVPNSVYPKLKALADKTYTHQFTVDGPPNLADAYIGSTPSWKTVLIGTTGAGARALFAMDVTNPVVSGSGGFGKDKVMWEFSDSTATYGTDMGYIPSYAHIGLMKDGTWAAIFGNGYDSASGKAVLFIVKLQTGEVLKAISVNVGSAGDKNGLSQPNMVLNANREIETIYAGDLKGNMWKFDVSSTSTTNWGVAFNGKPLFTTATKQPITVMPEITAHSDTAGGVIVSFGTGKSFEVEDTSTDADKNFNLSTQSLYGIWDKPGDNGQLDRSKLEARKIESTGTSGSFASFQSTTVASSYDANKRGWYLDLGANGERSNLSPQQVGDVLFMIANKPSVDPCDYGGSSKLFAFNPITGSIPTEPVFDASNDNKISADDKGYNVRMLSNGVLTQPVFQLGKLASATIQPGLTTAPFALFNRGQTSGARAGGVELSKTFGDKTTSSRLPCDLVANSAMSDTSIANLLVKVCTEPAGKGRISWRQLK